MQGGTGADVFDGGPGFDTILIEGTSGNDIIDVQQSQPGGDGTAVTLTHTTSNILGSVTEVDTIVINTNAAGAADDDVSVETGRRSSPGTGRT